MSTLFTMSQILASEPMPNIRETTSDPYYMNARWNFSMSGQPTDEIPTGSTIYPWLMYANDTASGITVDGWLTSVWESADQHCSWFKTWVSKPLIAQTISGNFGMMGLILENIFPWEETILFIRPAVRMYIWKADDSVGDYLFDGTSSEYLELGYNAEGKLYFDEEPINAATVSYGDRIVFELYFHHSNSEYGNKNVGFFWNSYISTETFHLSFSADILEGTKITNSVGLMYDLIAKVGNAVELRYQLATSFVTASTNLIYNLQGVLLQRDNQTPYRGEYSALISPPTDFDEPPTYTPLYDSTRWYDTGKATLNKYFMIDDFEGEAGFSDWTYATLGYPVKMRYSKTMIVESQPTDLSDYSVYSFFGRGGVINKVRIFLTDGYNTTLPQTFVLSDKWERYEREIVPQSCDMSAITTVCIEADYRGDMYIDDLLLLATDSENVDWTPLDVVAYKTKRNMRTGKIKIPYREGELIQFSGEDSGVGTLDVRNLSLAQKRFINSAYRDNVPLYYRYKNDGLPLHITNRLQNFDNVDRLRTRTRDTLQFIEVYNEEL